MANANRMDRLNKCSICLDTFRIPKVLPCMHTFCLAPCLSNLVEPRARSLRCPECRREHMIPAGGIRTFPDKAAMVILPDLPPPTIINLPDRCFRCKQPKQTLIKCHDCSNFVCSDCREPHLREAFYSISSSVNQLRHTLSQMNNRMNSNEQRVNNLKTNYEQVRRDVTLGIGNLIDQLKQRENMLLTEAEAHMQTQLRTFRLQQNPNGVNLTNVANFCNSVGTTYPNHQLITDIDLANIRSECNRYSQEINALQLQTPNDTQKLRFTVDNHGVIVSSLQNFGRLIDSSQENSQQPRYSQVAYPNVATNYVNSANNQRLTNSQTDVLSQTISYLPTQNQNSRNINNSFGDLSLTVPPQNTRTSQTTPWETQSNNQSSSLFGRNPFASTNRQSTEETQQRNYVTSTTAARSIEGDDRPIFGGRGRGGGGGSIRGRGGATNSSNQEQEPPQNSFQRRGTFVLDEPTLPNLPQSGAQKPRDKVNAKDLYKVRRRKRAQTPVAFTIDLSDSAAPTVTDTVNG